MAKLLLPALCSEGRKQTKAASVALPAQAEPTQSQALLHQPGCHRALGAAASAVHTSSGQPGCPTAGQGSC